MFTSTSSSTTAAGSALAASILSAAAATLLDDGFSYAMREEILKARVVSSMSELPFVLFTAP